MKIYAKLLSILMLMLSSTAFAGTTLYFTRGPEELLEGEEYSRNWEDTLNWSTVSPSGDINSSGSYNTSPAGSVPGDGDRAYLGNYSGFFGKDPNYQPATYVEVSSAITISQLKHKGAFVVCGISAITEDASINLVLSPFNSYTNDQGTQTNVVLDNCQWDVHFHVAIDVNLLSTTSGNMYIYNKSGSSKEDPAENLADKKNLYFDAGYKIEVLPDADGNYNTLYIMNAKSGEVNGHNIHTGDIIISSKIKTGGHVFLALDNAQQAVAGYTSGVIRFDGSESNELSATGMQLINGIVVESGMKDGAQVCSTAIQIMSGSTFRLLASNQVGDKASVQLKNPASAGGLGGIFELNGFSEKIATLYLYSDFSQTMSGIVDFGQNDVGQVLWASAYVLGGNIIVDGSQLIIKNYVLGEDHLFFNESLDDEKLATFVFEGYENGYKIVENIVEHEGASVYEYTLAAIPEPALAGVLIGVAAVAAAVVKHRRRVA